MSVQFLKNRIFWLNVSFWILFFSYKFYDYTNFMSAERAFVQIGLPMFFHILLSYTHYFFILPNLLRDKKLLPYLAKLLPTLAIIMSLSIMAENEILSRYSTSGYYQSVGFVRLVSTLWDHLSFMIFTGMIKFAVDWFELENRKKELENQKLNAELKFLKAQINPHFLFNTLHNLNYLTQAKKDEATEVVIKLSNIMRYMLRESDKKLVPIAREIAYVKDYLDLEKIRLNNEFRIDVDTSNLDDSIDIAPLILMPFIENAFKHGISDKYPDSWLDFKMNSSKDAVEMRIENSISEPNNERLQSGFGLVNVKKRLELSYPDQHELSISNTGEVFSVHLVLKRSV